jgi:hypothetical protein
VYRLAYRRVGEEVSEMSERQNTIVCRFDMASPRISAYQIHEWLHETLQLDERDVRMVQVDGPKRQVFIKFSDSDKMQTIVQDTLGTAEYRHDTGEISQVKIEFAGMGRRRIRIANLPPETPDSKIRTTLAKYGEIADISEEKWSKAYRYQVSNGVRIAHITLTRHVPSVINIDGVRALITYEGQPVTCFGCGETGHQYQGCTKKRNLRQQTQQSNTASWADIAQGLTCTTPQSMKEGKIAQAKIPENTNNYDTAPPHNKHQQR